MGHQNQRNELVDEGWGGVDGGGKVGVYIYILHNKYDIDVMKRLICSSVKSGKPIFAFL